MDVNATTGIVTGYRQVNELIEVESTPQIQQASAEQLAIDIAIDYLDDPTVVESKLVVVPPDFVPDRAQLLLWRVAIVGMAEQGEGQPKVRSESRRSSPAATGAPGPHVSATHVDK